MKEFIKKNKNGLIGLAVLIVAIAVLGVLYTRLSDKPDDGEKASPPPTITTAETPEGTENQDGEQNPGGEQTDGSDNTDGTPTDAVDSPTPTPQPAGSKKIIVKVVDKDGNVTEYVHFTDQSYLRKATEEIEGLTITGQESMYGLMIEAINGITAIYEKDGAYWSIEVNGEYGMHGIDEQPVDDGDVFAFVYTPA